MSARRKKPKVVTAFMARRRSDDCPALLIFRRHKDARILYGADYRIARVELHEIPRKGKRT